MIYLDYAATTKMDEEALTVFNEANRSYYGNTSSLHDIGGAAAQLLDYSREQLGKLCVAPKDGVIFTSGGTESNLLALSTLIASKKKEENHIITSRIEHSSIHSFLTKLEQEGYEISTLHHHANGMVDLEDLQNQIRATTFLVIVQHVNSEIGCIQSLEAIKNVIQGQGIFLHTDCVQSFTKLPLPTMCDSLSVSSHKVYGPKGVGAVIFSALHTLKHPLSGVSHERGFRAGTSNLPAIAAFVTAAQKAEARRLIETDRICALRTYFLSALQKKNIHHEVIENDIAQLPHIIALTFEGIQGQYMMLELNRRGFAVSTGSACSIGMQEPSPAMIAIGKSQEDAKRLIRISLGNETGYHHIDQLTDCIEEIIAQF